MTTSLSNRDQLDIAINGSQQFHAKSASNGGQVRPDIVIDGHREMAARLQNLSQLFGKTAEYVAQGYPAKVAVDHLAREAGVDPDYVQKLGSYLDDLGDLVLTELVLDTFDRKLRAKQAQATPPQPARSAGPNSVASSERVAAAMRRLEQLGGTPK